MNNTNKRLVVVITDLLLSLMIAYAQIKIKTIEGNDIISNSIDSTATDFIYYSIDNSNCFFRIQKEAVCQIINQNVKHQLDNKILLEGNLLKNGNCVYIPVESKYAFEKEGQLVIKEKIKELSCWIVVDNPNDAHFVLQFITELTGRDASWLFFRERDNYLKDPLRLQSFDGVSVGRYVKSGESVDENRRAANLLFNQLKEIVLRIDKKHPDSWPCKGVSPITQSISQLKGTFVK